MRGLVRTTQFVALGLVILLATGCKDTAATTSTLAPSTSSLVSGLDVVETGRLTALGTILPAQRVKLGFGASGPVRVVQVQVGTQVKAGDVLAELNTTDLELAVQEAEDGVEKSRDKEEQLEVVSW